jgi:flagella basal body P-ring formation protein FlgA
MALPAFAALPGVCRAARLHGAAQRALRAAAALAVAVPGLALPGLALTVAGAVPASAYAQDSGGPIVIPGPGEKNPADAQALAARMGMTPHATQPSAAALAALRPTPAAQRVADPDNAQIVLAGPGAEDSDTSAGASPASGTRSTRGTVTSGRVTMSGTPPGIPATWQQVKVQTAANGVAPVVVSNARARYSAPASDMRAADAPQASAPVEIDPLAARGEPPQLGGPGGTAAVKTQLPAVRIAQAQPAAAQTVQPAQTAEQAAVRPAIAVQAPAPAASGARMQPVRYTPPVPAAGTSAPAAAAAAGANALAASAAVLPGQQDPESIRTTALNFLQQQTAGLPGKITITVAPPFARGLAGCTALEPFMPVGARLWGRTSVGVRCAGARPWTIYLQARISLQATYYTAARQIAPGETLSAADLVAHDGDLATLPQSVITDPSQAIGAVALVRIGAGLPLRQDTVRSTASVSIGQTVHVVASGEGFTISAEGSAMNNAAPGQQVRVKTSNGQIVTGIVKDGSTVEIQM